MSTLNPAVALASLAALAVGAAPAGAQAAQAPAEARAAASPPQSSSSAAADERQATGSAIIVTAQRRRQRLIDVPIAVRAITGDEIARRDVTSLSAMQSAVPSLRMVDLGVGTQRIELRGVSQFLGLPTVGNYVDEFSINNFSASGTPDIRLIDMQRVEVLRGPQPVLYGEGSMGGTIRYVTADPDLTRYGGHVEAEVSSVDHGGIGYRAQGVVNVPLVEDKIGVRLVAAREKVGDWIDAPDAPGGGKNVNAADYTTFRGKLLVKPDDNLSLSLLVAHQEGDQQFKNYSNRDYVTDAITASPLKQRYTFGNFIATYKAPGATILLSTGLMRLYGRTVDDLADYYNKFVFGAPVLTTALGDSRSRLKKFSQELRITSDLAGPFSYVFGAIYTDGRTYSKLSGRSDPPIPGLEYDIDEYDRSASWAFYGSIGVDLGRRLHLDAGGRYYLDSRSQHAVTSLLDLLGPGVPLVIPSDQSQQFHTFDPRVALTFKTGGDGTIYISAAKGFRSGGFNLLGQPAYGPETLWTYEAGLKQSFANGRVYVELAGYYNKYDNVQTVSPLTGSTITATTNSGRASGPGVDATISVRPARDLSLSGNLGYSHVRFDTTTTDRFKGEPLDLVPDWTYNVAVDYTPALSEHVRLVGHADYGYSDKARITLHTPVLNQIAYTEARAQLNARIGASFGTIEAYVFGANLTNTSRIVNPAFGSYFEPIYTRPRTIGLGLKADF
ncbi:MAG TPA: TonB-dependent receptor [Sphingomonas sp.]|nr:TonB-dependent receptor [Sphingomonas sp.]